MEDEEEEEEYFQFTNENSFVIKAEVEADEDLQ